jgi:hypothetical protein
MPASSTPVQQAGSDSSSVNRCAQFPISARHIARCDLSLTRQDQCGTVNNLFRLRGANRKQATAERRARDRRSAGNELRVVRKRGGCRWRSEFGVGVETAAPPSPPLPRIGVKHFRLVNRVGNERDSEEETFIMPFKDSR